jgi:Rod binding domain-containing protein
MSVKWKLLSMFAAVAVMMGACSNSEETATTKTEKSEQTDVKPKEEKRGEKAAEIEKEEANYADVFKQALAELEKAKQGQKVDFDKVTKLYQENLQTFVQKRDAEFQDKLDQQITTALAAGKDGSLDPMVVKQIFDKLMQKAFYAAIKHEFTEVEENWTNKETVKKDIEEAKQFYAILQPTVEKRDVAYGTKLAEAIDGAFAQIEDAAAKDDLLAFSLGKQAVDKTLMKTFYLATGALPHGYASKAAAAAKQDAKEAKVEQAEGWAFYQSVYPYMKKHAPEEADYILKQFDLQTDVKMIDPTAVNKAFIRGWAKVALDEYKESKENWGQDKSAITALEGALFINMMESDLKALLGSEAYKMLNDQAKRYLEAAKAKNKAEGEKLLSEIETTLHTIVEKAK